MLNYESDEKFYQAYTQVWLALDLPAVDLWAMYCAGGEL